MSAAALLYSTAEVARAAIETRFSAHCRKQEEPRECIQPGKRPHKKTLKILAALDNY